MAMHIKPLSVFLYAVHLSLYAHPLVAEAQNLLFPDSTPQAKVRRATEALADAFQLSRFPAVTFNPCEEVLSDRLWNAYPS
jgi:hypothetical protein